MSDWSALRNRLSKNWQHVSKWARRRDIHCFRVYDRDIPEFPLIIDWYAGHVHIQEYETHWQQTDAAHSQWLQQVQSTVALALSVSAEQIHCKLRRRQRGQSQYQKTGVTGHDIVVEEQGHRFWVNLDAYIDTGLFLDHRPTRQRVQREAAGKRMLNLFCYTGAFTVYAASGGAISTESVDLSNTYLAWARRNLLLNQLDLARNKLVRAEVRAYLSAAKKTDAQFDLIVLDPPSFSNSTQMQQVLDIQRDHSALINDCLALLSMDGILYFSTNRRGFTLDQQWHRVAKDISQHSIPDDFRNKKIHQCWRFVKPAVADN